MAKKRSQDQRGRFVSYTKDPLQDRRDRVTKALKLKRNWKKSNRVLAAELEVDESMVRKYKRMLGVPQLPQHGGRSE